MLWGTVVQRSLQLLFVVCLADPKNTAHARSFRRFCQMQNEMGLMTDAGVRIEPLEQSHVQLWLGQKQAKPTAERIVRNRYVIRFEFRTRGDNGILLYGRTRQEGAGELLALRLMGGDLYYKIQCPTVSADLLFPHPGKLNDGRWHSVLVRFRHDMTEVEVDGVRDSKRYEMSCGKLTSLVFGGVSPRDKQVVNGILGNIPHYDGCIRRVSTSQALRSAPKYHAISVCEQ